MRLTLLLLALAVAPLAWLGLGRLVAGLLAPPPAPGRRRAALTLLGLLAHLAAMLFLRSAGLPWAPALLLPAALALLRRHDVLAALRTPLPALTWNGSLWLTVSLALGASLFDVVDALRTTWSANFGDLAFHMGMISSFTFGDDFPPRFHLFAGETLSYPFLVNLWTAAFWWIEPTLTGLKLICLVQWLTCWTLVYRALEGDRLPVLPWALLLGGGTWHWVLAHTVEPLLRPELDALAAHTNLQIDRGLPWVPFLEALWIPQRPWLLGLPACLTAVHCIRAGDLAVGALLLGLAPLAHAHCLLVTAAVAMTLVALDRATPLLPRLQLLALGLAPGLLFLPWLLGKSSIISLQPGWLPWPAVPDGAVLPSLVNSARMWARNAPLWFLSLLLLGRGAWGTVAALGALFLLGNVVLVAVWPWDQIKIFAALYAMTLAAWTALPAPVARRRHWLLLLLLLPATVETGRILCQGESYEIYGKDALAWAAEARRALPPRAVLLAAPAHNSPATLTGRPLYMGYDGTLYSHGVPYAERQAFIKDLARALSSERWPGPRPEYLAWTEAEQSHWKMAKPPPDAPLQETFAPGLYRLRTPWQLSRESTPSTTGRR